MFCKHLSYFSFSRIVVCPMSSRLFHIPLRLSIPACAFVRSRPVTLVRSRPVSTVAAAGPLFSSSPSIVPTIVAVLGVAIALAGSAFSIGSFYHSELARIEGLTVVLKSDMAGMAGKLEERMAGLKETITKEVDAKVAGSKEEVKATMAGAKDEVKATMAGTTAKLEERVAGIERAADLKVRRLRACVPAFEGSISHPCSPNPLAVQDQIDPPVIPGVNE